MKIGTFIRTKHNIHHYYKDKKPEWVYRYYKLCDGKFEIKDCSFCSENETIRKYEGKHFVCQGSDYFSGEFGWIDGLQLLEEEFEIVGKLPSKLKK